MNNIPLMFMLIGLLNLAATVGYSVDCIAEIQSAVGKEFEVKRFDNGHIRVMSTASYLGRYVGVSSFDGDEPSQMQMILWGEIVVLKKDERVQDIRIINDRLNSEIDTLESRVLAIPHQMNKTEISGYEYKPTTENDIATLGLYRALCAAVRPIPNAKFSDTYLFFKKVEIDFVNDLDDAKYDSVLSALRNIAK